MTGTLPPYADPAYATALAAAFGGGHHALRVAAWGGAAVLLRPIGATGLVDACGPYPLLPFGADWDIAAGLAEIAAAGAVSLVAVADPLSPPGAATAFAHHRPYKRHHLVLDAAGIYAPAAHHLRHIRRAARHGGVAEVPAADRVDDWLRLQAGLAARRGFTGGMQDFPRATIDALAGLGLRAFAAFRGDAVVAMGMWFRHGGTAWYHLGAADDAGREGGAGHAVMDFAIRTLLAEGVTRIVLGGGLAPIGAPPCGLDRFKAGFGNATRPSLLLGAVLDARAHARLGGDAGAGFFPPYRAPRPAAA
ncbi:GNAT family N-acetyltransferase [Falsiroseomonas sp. CW058]|uniref:GNAT family N-acetyltransferase n=1 Tax=Falsiroseomonas sp. CW058 TaxID=3388664 RepID=UPI003D312FA6